MPTQRSIDKKHRLIDLTNIKSKQCDNKELADQFINDFLRVAGLDIDEEGYIVNSEEDPIEPDYILVKNKALRRSNNGILHSTDMIFDPYNNPMIMEEMFRSYIAENHPEVCNFQIMGKNEGVHYKVNSMGYITIRYNNGAIINTKLHYKDATKYLEAFMRMEGMGDDLIGETIGVYDAFEASMIAQGKDLSKPNKK